MVKNVGPADSYIRFMVGISFLVNIIILSPGILGSIILFVLGAAMLVTAYTGFCGFYSIIKVNTCKESCAAEGGAPQQPAHH
jgi:hypothetical protein